MTGHMLTGTDHPCSRPKRVCICWLFTFIFRYDHIKECAFEDKWRVAYAKESVEQSLDNLISFGYFKFERNTRSLRWRMERQRRCLRKCLPYDWRGSSQSPICEFPGSHSVSVCAFAHFLIPFLRLLPKSCTRRWTKPERHIMLSALYLLLVEEKY